MVNRDSRESFLVLRRGVVIFRAGPNSIQYPIRKSFDSLQKTPTTPRQNDCHELKFLESEISMRIILPLDRVLTVHAKCKPLI